MAGKSVKFLKNKQVAKLVTENRQPCIFCQQDVDDEVIYGKLYALGDIQCHYFCVLLSCCMVQKGKDTEGLFGFLYRDIIAEVERSKKHKCSYCGRGGASLGCAVSQCRKQFHLPCGRRKNVVSLFYGNYKSFCELHAPKQKISNEVMVNVKVRLKKERMLKCKKKPAQIVEVTQQDSAPPEADEAPVCVICYEAVQGYPCTQTFWPPCCGRDAWLHRTCLQRMALSAGMHYIKCPLCNDKEQFYEAVCEQGYYLPDRDAAWELEQNAFAEIYERPESCAATECSCPFGRSHDEPGMWDIKLCILCGSCGMHARCLAGARMLCAACRPAAQDIQQLETRLASVIKAEQEREARAARSGPVMPSRMSLRRTKTRLAAHSASSSSAQNVQSTELKTEIKTKPTETTIVSAARQDLNLKPPKRAKFLVPSILKNVENTLLSPIKMLEQSYMEKMGGVEVPVNPAEVLEKMRAKFNKPKPLSAKRRIIDEILNDIFQNVFKENMENNDLAKNWTSPKKCLEPIEDPNKDSKDNQPTLIVATENEKPNNQIEEPCEDNDEIKTNDPLDISTDLADGNTISEEMIADEKHGENDATAEENTKSNDVDDESTSAVKPPELAAENDDGSFDTPKNLKTVDIEHSTGLEISEHNEIVTVNMIEVSNGKEQEFVKSLIIKSPIRHEKCFIKYSTIDKEVLETIDVDMDVEKFKDQYLNEVGRDFKCNFDHNHVVETENDKVITTAIDFAIDATRKRKLQTKSGKDKRIKKKKFRKNDEKDNQRVKKFKKKEGDRVKLKIKLKDGTEKKKKKTKIFKQYVLKYSAVQSSKVIGKPETDISPIRKKFQKPEKSPDKLVQTSIQSFFKVK